MDGSEITHIPDFDLPATTGLNLSLDSFLGTVPLAIVFLPEIEEDGGLLDSLDAALPRFGANRAQLLVVVRCSIEGAAELAEHRRLQVPVLADEAGEVTRRFGAFEGVNRLRAVVGSADGRLVARFDAVSSDALIDRLLAEVRDLEPGGDVEGSAIERTGVSKIGHDH